MLKTKWLVIQNRQYYIERKSQMCSFYLKHFWYGGYIKKQNV